MNQKGVNALYERCMDRDDENWEKADATWNKELAKVGATAIVCDWTELDFAVQNLLRLLKRHGFTVLQEPSCQGTDSQGWIIVEPKRKKQRK